jgi:hypothetical protein
MSIKRRFAIGCGCLILALFSLAGCEVQHFFGVLFHGEEPEDSPPGLPPLAYTVKSSGTATGPVDFDTLANALTTYNALTTSEDVVITLDSTAPPLAAALTISGTATATGKITIKDANATKIVNTAGIAIARNNVELNGLKFALTDVSKAHELPTDTWTVVHIADPMANVTVTGLNIAFSENLTSTHTSTEAVVGIGAWSTSIPATLSITNNTIDLATGTTLNPATQYTNGIGIGADTWSAITVTGNTVTASLGYDFEEVLETTTTIPVGGTFTAATGTAVGCPDVSAFYRLLYKESANVFTSVTNFGAAASATADTTAVKALGSGAVGTTITSLGTSKTIIVHDGQFTAGSKKELWTIGATAGTLTAKDYWNGTAWASATSF